MKNLLSLLFWKIQSFQKFFINHYQRNLFFQNKNSKIHSSFKLGNDNSLKINPEALFFIKENVVIDQNNFITVKKGAKLNIGKDSYITRATISCLGEIEIGENCILGEGMKLFDHNHHYANNPFYVSKTEFNIGKIKIGSNVWTGANVTILKDVIIGDNCIIGAGCVIHKDVPANSIIINKQDHILKSL